MEKIEKEIEQTEENELDQVLENIDSLIKEHHKNIELNKQLQALKNNKQFKNIISKLFIDDGKSYLWDNIKEHEELDLLQKGTARAGNVERFKVELQARLILGKFFETIEDEAEHAEQSIQEAEDYRYQLLNPIEGE